MTVLANYNWFWNSGGKWYEFWSGFGSDIGEFAILGSVYTLYHRHRCSSCWRLAHHPVPGTIYKTCHKHATVEEHARLTAKHKIKFPKQHELLNRRHHAAVPVENDSIL
jgi:hypothetical protein